MDEKFKHATFGNYRPTRESSYVHLIHSIINIILIIIYKCVLCVCLMFIKKLRDICNDNQILMR